MSNRIDTFNRANHVSTLGVANSGFVCDLGTPSDGGSDWLMLNDGSGQIGIFNNQAFVTAILGQAYLESGSKNVLVQATIVSLSGGGEPTVAARMNPDNGSVGASVTVSATTISLVGGGGIVLGTFAHSTFPVTIGLLCQGGRLAAIVDGVQRITALDTTNAGHTHHGLSWGVGGAGGITYDNVSVASAAASIGELQVLVGAELAVDGVPLGLGTMLTGSTQTRIITIKNIAASNDLVIGSFDTSSFNLVSVTSAPATPLILAPGQSVQVNLSVDTSGTGVVTEDFIISSDDNATPLFVVHLSGELFTRGVSVTPQLAEVYQSTYFSINGNLVTMFDSGTHVEVSDPSAGSFDGEPIGHVGTAARIDINFTATPIPDGFFMFNVILGDGTVLQTPPITLQDTVAPTIVSAFYDASGFWSVVFSEPMNQDVSDLVGFVLRIGGVDQTISQQIWAAPAMVKFATSAQPVAGNVLTMAYDSGVGSNVDLSGSNQLISVDPFTVENRLGLTVKPRGHLSLREPFNPVRTN